MLLRTMSVKTKKKRKGLKTRFEICFISEVALLMAKSVYSFERHHPSWDGPYPDKASTAALVHGSIVHRNSGFTHNIVQARAPESSVYRTAWCTDLVTVWWYQQKNEKKLLGRNITFKVSQLQTIRGTDVLLQHVSIPAWQYNSWHLLPIRNSGANLARQYLMRSIGHHSPCLVKKEKQYSRQQNPIIEKEILTHIYISFEMLTTERGTRDQRRFQPDAWTIML